MNGTPGLDMEFRGRLQNAVHSVTVSPELEQRIRQSLRPEAKPVRSWYWASAMAVAAALVLCVSGAIVYQLGYLRVTVASQEAYIGHVSQQVSGIMRVGLGDHIHCAVFRKFPKDTPSLEKMTSDMGPQYKDLIAVVQRNIPTDFKVVMAHRCSYHRRKFVHVTVTNGSVLSSLVVAFKNDGEAFDRDKLIPALSQSGIPMYESGVQRFKIAAFETPKHLVYLVSDLGGQKNIQWMTAFAPGIREVLHRLES